MPQSARPARRRSTGAQVFARAPPEHGRWERGAAGGGSPAAGNLSRDSVSRPARNCAWKSPQETGEVAGSGATLERQRRFQMPDPTRLAHRRTSERHDARGRHRPLTRRDRHLSTLSPTPGLACLRRQANDPRFTAVRNALLHSLLYVSRARRSTGRNSWPSFCLPDPPDVGHAQPLGRHVFLPFSDSQLADPPYRRRRRLPDPEALLRLAGAVLIEAHDEWQVSDRRYLPEGSMALLNRPEPVEEVAQPALIASWSLHR
jgi:hypothetical protein